MNVLIFSWRGPNHPNAGGAEIVTHEYAKGWIKNDHLVTLFTSYYKGAKRQEIIDGVNIIRSGSQFFGVQWEAFKWYLFGSHHKYDLIIDQFHGIPFFTPIYIRIKKLGFIHEVTKEVWRLNQWPIPFNFFVAFIGNLIEPLIFKLYRNINFMTVSKSTKKDLIVWGIPADNITVIHNGINTPSFKNHLGKEKIKTLIYLGALEKDKGIEDALLIFSKINFHKDWQFWVVGKAALVYLNKIKMQSRKLRLEKKVKFWGFVSEKKKFELLERAHIVINPSIREGWGLVVIEAASVGTPTAAFNVAGLRDSIIDNKTGILSSEHTIESLATKIIELLEDERRYNRICHNAKVWSKNFSWASSVKQSLSLLKEVYENA